MNCVKIKIEYTYLTPPFIADTRIRYTYYLGGYRYIYIPTHIYALSYHWGRYLLIYIWVAITCCCKVVN